MADKQISDLTAATGLTDGSLFVLEQGGVAKNANWGLIKSYISPTLAPQYSSSLTYKVGDYVIYNDSLYRCTTAITTAESWTAAHWTAAILGNDVSGIKNSLDSNYLYNDLYPISGSLVDSRLPDLNTISGFSKSFHFVPTSAKRPANMPSDAGNEEYYCLVQLAADIPAGGQTFQLLANTTKLWIRYKRSSSAWTDWTLFIDSKNNLASNGLQLNPSTGQTYLPDLNGATKNTAYSFVNTSAWSPANMPSNSPHDIYWTLMTLGFGSGNGAGGTTQILLNSVGDKYTRYKLNSSTWDRWFKIEEQYVITVAKDGSGDYSSVVEAITEARKTPNTKVFIKDGTYDLIEEIEDYIAADFFTNYSNKSSLKDYRGIALYNGITIEMSSNALLTCHFAGDGTNPNDVDIRSYFSPFQTYSGDCTLINVRIEASNVRYCVHDDVRNKNVGPNHHVFIGCNFTLDNRQALHGNPDTCSCLGGGLDYSTFIECYDCVFTAYGSTTQNPVSDPTVGCAGYHNHVSAGSRSNVIFRGCYATYGTFTFGMYGESTEVTDVSVSGCSVCSQPYTYYETQDYHNENMALKKWNNEIRA